MSSLRRISLLLFALALSLIATPPAARAQGVHVSIDGRPVSFDQPPVMVGGRVLVPLRGIFEGLGATVTYSAASRAISASRGGTSVQLALGSSQASVNGAPVAMDVPAQTIGGRTMVPLRFVSEALGADVRWNAATQSVAITSPGAPVGNLPPGPMPSPSASMPQITGIVLSSRSLHPGDTLRVTMTGTPGGSATFDVAGLQSGILMREITAGQYRGEFPIDEGMTTRRANVVVHLQANGLESQQQAEQTVSVGPLRRGPSGQAPSTADISIAPSGPWYAGQTLTITASGIPGAYATMRVGGSQDIPLQQTAPGTYIGLYTLGPGDNHPMPVTVTYRLPNGGVTSMTAPQPLGIGLGGIGYPYPQGPGGYPYPGGGIYLNVTSPPSGQHVTGDFTLAGTTVPYAMVQVQGTVHRPLIPGVIGLPTRQVSAGGQADANGNFSIPVRVGPVPARGTLTLQAQATDPAGRTSQWQQVQFATGP